ncbi:S-layer protein [Thermococcus argininiproducens]|uniref:S-layer protein n=1 Tax=Thermococcus argininiproducens TaxID=2866384 RepID=A0A9E7SD34_9EURY|nr:S-layer protein [Thermococcus argininiproducens]USH00385.1 S-layer protein [Thermococcus argininiproducens]
MKDSTALVFVLLVFFSLFLVPPVSAGSFHSGTLIIDGTEYKIEDSTLLQEGNIIVQNGGKLIIKNATLELLQDYHAHYGIIIKDNSQLIVENSIITSDYQFYIRFHSNSKGSFVGLSFTKKAPIISLSSGRPILEIVDSIFDGLEVTSYLSGAQVTIKNSEFALYSWLVGKVNVTNLYEGFKLGSASIVSEKYTVNIHNSTISGAWMWIQKDAEVIIKDSYVGTIEIRDFPNIYLVNSTVGTFTPRLEGIEVSMSLNPGFYENYTIDLTHEGAWFLRLENSRILEWDVNILSNTKVTLQGSKLAHIALTAQDTNSTVLIKDSEISWLEIKDFKGSITFDHVTITGWVSIYKETETTQEIRIDGNVTIFPNTLNFMFGLKWHDSIVKRRYPIILKEGMFYNAYKNYSIEIKDPEGNSVYSSSIVNMKPPTLIFNSSNYDKSFSLILYGENSELTVTPISLLTSTPISLKVGDKLDVSRIRASPVIYGEGRVDKEYAWTFWRKMCSDRVPAHCTESEIVVLIGGPVANKLTRDYMDNFPVEVTNEYPGKGKGVIEATVIDGKIYILVAGSDRWGTKAGVEILKDLDYISEKPIFVDWNDGNPKIVPGG